MKSQPSLPVRFHRAAVMLCCAAMVVTPLQAGAQVQRVPALADLVGTDYTRSQAQLGNRGYTAVHADQRGGKVWQYWWGAREHLCARVAYIDDRVTSIVEALATDCNQPPPADASNDRGMGTGAKVAIAAAALLGVAALVHRSHERDEQKHRDEQQVAEYERGYRDGLYHQPYHDYNRSQSYVDGYNAGQQKREAETGYRSNRGHHSGQAGFVAVNDLVGARGGSADDRLRERGFAQRGSWDSQGKRFASWWNRQTRQCLQVVVTSGRVESIESIIEGNCT